MRIVRVELQNIKSYRDAVIDLQRGVTAIRGHNGAGKSTLVEAIGWALFNTLPYTQEMFVREGEKFGKVTVRFISPKDDREYEVVRRCGNGATWWVVDPETGVRHDSAADIQSFIREQFQIDGSITLADLFNSAIGVPQGSLTADFLMSPANRKKRFDALLQVEDYATAAKNLNETVSHLKQKRAGQDKDIEGLERDVAQLDEARAQLEDLRVSLRALEAERDRFEREAEQVEARRNTLLQAQTEVMRREGAAAAAAAELTGARQRLASAEALLTEARDAARAVDEARQAHERYLKAEREQAAARLRQRDRDDLRQREAAAAARQAETEASARHTRQRLTAVEQAEREIVALQGAVTRQGELERGRDAARQDSEKLRDARARASRGATALAELNTSIESRQREIAVIEAARAKAEALSERKRMVEELQAAAAVRQQREARRTAIASERNANAKRREDASRDATKLAENVRKLEGVRTLVDRLPALTESERAASEAVASAEARMAQSRVSRDQAGAGNCPFLAEPCLNIQKRGENNLRAYFDKRIADEERALGPLQEKLKVARALADDARMKKLHLERMEEFQGRLTKALEAIKDCDDASARLDTEEAEIGAGLKRGGDATALAKAQAALQASETADRRLATLASVQRDLADKRDQRAREAAEHAQLTSLATALAGAPEALRAAEAELAALGDPRKTVNGLSARAAERGALEDALAKTERELAALKADRAGITASLAPYANLDAELTMLDAELSRTRAAHTRFVQNENAAALLPARGAECEEAKRSYATAEASDGKAREALAAARKRFDASELARVSERATALSDARGENRQRLQGTRTTIEALEERLRVGQARVAALDAARVERDKLAAMETTLQQFRELLREAGPQVTRALLSRISSQANAIFGDIMGDRAGVLAWENEYEITLRRDGATRTFAQLSGGEQMTAALAVRLALLRQLTRLDMAFFDEPTQNMDGERRSALAEQLRRVRGFEQLIVISHDDTFEQGLDGVIHLEKRDGATRVAEGEDVYATESPLEDDLSALAL
ncbi:MAG TPA: SMC family ATPase [Ktedonobacterales bacterium]